MHREKIYKTLREEFQALIEGSIWQGEDAYTKNFVVGNITEWWIIEIDSLLEEESQRLIKEIEKMLIRGDPHGNSALQDVIRLLK